MLEAKNDSATSVPPIILELQKFDADLEELRQLALAVESRLGVVMHESTPVVPANNMKQPTPISFPQSPFLVGILSRKEVVLDIKSIFISILARLEI